MYDRSMSRCGQRGALRVVVQVKLCVDMSPPHCSYMRGGCQAWKITELEGRGFAGKAVYNLLDCTIAA